MKLSESQSKIYKNDKILLELNEKNLVLKKEAAQSLKEKNTGKAEKLAIEKQYQPLGPWPNQSFLQLHPYFRKNLHS